jgi:hypothetical protein
MFERVKRTSFLHTNLKYAHKKFYNISPCFQRYIQCSCLLKASFGKLECFKNNLSA